MSSKPRAVITVFVFLCFAPLVIPNATEQTTQVSTAYSPSLTTAFNTSPCIQNQDWGQECEIDCRLGQKVCSKDGESLVCQPFPRKEPPKQVLGIGTTAHSGYADEFFCNTDPDCEEKVCPFEKPVCSKGACFDPMEDPDSCGSLGNKCPKDRSFCARGVCSADPVHPGLPFTAKYLARGQWVVVSPSCINPANPTKLLCDPLKVTPRTWPLA